MYIAGSCPALHLLGSRERKSKDRKLHLSTRKNFLIVSMIEQYNGSSRDAVNSPFLESVKTQMSMILGILCSEEGQWDLYQALSTSATS